MKTLAAPLILVALLTLVPSPAVAHCFDYGPDGTRLWQLTDGSAEHTFYVDDHGFAAGEGVWIWAEANGLWTPKLPGAYHANAWWAQDDLQIGGCGDLNVGLCEPPWMSCPDVAYPPDMHIF